MKRALCAAILSFEAVVLGLTTPVLISIQGVGTAKGLWIGLGLMVLCILTAGMLRRPWAYTLGWLVQLAAISLGFEITAMFFLGLVFFVLWLTAFLLGGRIETDRAHREAAQQPLLAPSVTPPAAWQYELACDEHTPERFVQQAVAELRTPRNLVLIGAGVVLGLGFLLVGDTARPVGALLLAAAIVFPLVTWLVQRQAWRSFLAPGRVFRTAFEDDRLVMEADGNLAEVAYADVADVTTKPGLVSVETTEGHSVQLPEAVFPESRVQQLAARP